MSVEPGVFSTFEMAPVEVMYVAYRRTSSNEASSGKEIALCSDDSWGLRPLFKLHEA